MKTERRIQRKQAPVSDDFINITDGPRHSESQSTRM